MGLGGAVCPLSARCGQCFRGHSAVRHEKAMKDKFTDKVNTVGILPCTGAVDHRLRRRSRAKKSAPTRACFRPVHAPQTERRSLRRGGLWVTPGSFSWSLYVKIIFCCAKMYLALVSPLEGNFCFAKLFLSDSVGENLFLRQILPSKCR